MVIDNLNLNCPSQSTLSTELQNTPSCRSVISKVFLQSRLRTVHYEQIGRLCPKWERDTSHESCALSRGAARIAKGGKNPAEPTWESWNKNEVKNGTLIFFFFFFGQFFFRPSFSHFGPEAFFLFCKNGSWKTTKKYKNFLMGSLPVRNPLKCSGEKR